MHKKRQDLFDNVVARLGHKGYHWHEHLGELEVMLKEVDTGIVEMNADDNVFFWGIVQQEAEKINVD